MLAATILFVVITALLFSSPRSREWIMEELKAVSDFLVLAFLRLTSRFGSELTEDGRAEQNLWREQRLRNLSGLTLRSKEKSRISTEEGHGG